MWPFIIALPQALLGSRLKHFKVCTAHVTLESKSDFSMVWASIGPGARVKEMVECKTGR